VRLGLQGALFPHMSYLMRILGSLYLQLGMTSMYNFWAYPEHVRLRLSQILVLPPYQDAGLGKRMLQAGTSLLFAYVHVYACMRLSVSMVCICLCECTCVWP
jgi:ribosomal protein S18 acetylase RimI-like enzyme